MQTEQLEAHAHAAVDILRKSIQLQQTGGAEFYRVAAVQLRILLCDTTRRHNRVEDISLLPRLIGDFQLRSPTSQEHIPLRDWLASPLPLHPPLTVRELLRRACDQEGGAHVDPHPETPPPPEGAEWIVRLGEILLGELQNQPAWIVKD